MDFAAFEASINAPAKSDEPEPEGDKPEGEGESTPADPAAEKKEEGDKPAKPSFQKRMDEVTKARREAERQAEEANRQLAELKAELEQLRQDREFEGEALTQAEIDSLVEAKLAEREQRKAAEESQRAAEAQQKAFQDRMEKAAEAHDDYFDVVIEGANRNAWQCTPEMLAALQDSEQGGEIAYLLAKDPDMSRRIAALPPVSQVREIGKLEASLTASKPETKPAKVVTDAPKPAPQLRGTGGQFKVSPDTDDFSSFEKQYGG